MDEADRRRRGRRRVGKQEEIFSIIGGWWGRLDWKRGFTLKKYGSGTRYLLSENVEDQISEKIRTN